MPDIFQLQSPSKLLKAEVELPSSKSISNRLLIINALSNGALKIHNLSNSQDTQILKNAIDNLKINKNIDIGEAGTALRFLTALLANTPGEYLLSGSARMQERPIEEMVNALISIGADISYAGKPGFAPLKIKGKTLIGGEVTINAGISSQFVSGLMLIAPLMKKGLRINLEGHIMSASYILMTYDLMKKFGIDIKFEKSSIIVKSGKYLQGEITVEPDWTSASYFYSILALAEGGEILLKDIKEKSIQGDVTTLKLFTPLGIESQYNESGLLIKKTRKTKIKFAEINFLSNPDLAQTMAVCLAGLNISAVFTGLQTLKHKETDRISALKKEIKKIGYNFEETDNDKWFLDPIEQTEKIKENPVFETYNDHRMAMSFATLSMKLDRIQIKNPEVVGKSFPGFWNNLKNLGFVIAKI
ncbi:MAG: 3-phosphoshikimate 1-carboxyvinyltransferase [Bacteroidetes bacterium]|nr:3-phosphoshikimate 1-carboxyvinyltransferase [Bacteroidota bacterium]